MVPPKDFLRSKLMCENDTYLMVAIFQQAYQAGEFISDPVVYA